MRIEPPAPGSPRRPDGPRDPGDAWVVTASGERLWGRFGAAGLLAVDPDRGVLLQHRVGWSHHGGTWGLPGGALHEDESALRGALREAGEEAGVPADAVRVRFQSVLDREVWSYSTVVADVTAPFEASISDPESLDLRWVPVDDVDSFPLHPGFGAAWPELRELLPVRPALVVDAANVVGSVPDGWWRDRSGAAARLRQRLADAVQAGLPAAELGLGADRWYPEVALVVEGAAKAIADETGPVRTVRADGSGDDAIVAEAARLGDAGRRVVVVTSDRELAGRVRPAEVRGAGWLRGLLGDRTGASRRRRL